MHIPLTPTLPALQFSEYVVDLPPRGSIEVVALRKKVSDDDRINTVAVQEDNDGKSLWIGHVRLSEHHPLDRPRPSMRPSDEVLQENEVLSFDR